MFCEECGVKIDNPQAKFCFNCGTRIVAHRPQGKATNQFNVGAYIQFGNYDGKPIDWVVIHINDLGNPLLYSKHVLCLKAFDDPELGGSNQWKRSSLRHWLNRADIDPIYHEEGFLSEQNFSSSERSYMTNFDQDDKVTLLSYDELYSFVHKQGMTETFIKRPKIIKSSDDHSYYAGTWLRSPGSNSALVQLIPKNNRMEWIKYEDEQDCINKGGGVRPALYINMEKISIASGSGTETDPLILA